MNPSERIRAALSRSDATKQTTTIPEFEPKAEVEHTLRILAEADEDRVVTPKTAVAADTPSAPKRTAAPRSSSESTDSPSLRRFRRHHIAIAALTLMAVTAVLTRDRWTSAIKSTTAAPGLQVEVRSEGNGLLSVRWNPASTVVAQAREGRLVILEANQQRRVVALQPEQLKSGHVYYQSGAERLEFQLEIVSASGATVKESVLALSSGKTEPAAAVENTPANDQQATATQNKSAVTVESKLDRAAKPDKTKSKTSADPAATPLSSEEPQRPAARVFTPPPLTIAKNATVDDARAVLLDPSTAPTAAVAPARLNLPQTIGAVPTPPVKAPSPPATGKLNVGGMVQPPVLIKKVAPVYPTFARSSRIEGVVKFTATIDKTGRVRNLQLLGGPQLLVKAAADAVKQWVYRPMQLDGSAMEVITQIEVRFALRD